MANVLRVDDLLAVAMNTNADLLPLMLVGGDLVLDPALEAAVQEGMQRGLDLVALYNYIRPVCLSDAEGWEAAHAMLPNQAIILA